MKHIVEDFGYFGYCLEGFLFGVYSGIFAVYLQLQYHRSQKSTDKANNMLFYSLCMLYAFTMATIILDIVPRSAVADPNILHPIGILRVTSFGCCDFLAQSILIYRCWIVWSRDIKVVTIPLFLTFAFLIIWIAGGIAPLSIIQGEIFALSWSHTLNVTGIALSLTVNALVTWLMTFKILKVFREIKTTTDGENFGGTSASTFRGAIFILIESGMTLFSIQLARLVVTSLSVIHAYQFVIPLHEMINGITPTIILVRVSMGLSFHNEGSMEASIGTLCFDVPDPTSVLEGSIADQERRDVDIGIELIDDSKYATVDE